MWKRDEFKNENSLEDVEVEESMESDVRMQKIPGVAPENEKILEDLNVELEEDYWTMENVAEVEETTPMKVRVD